MAYGSRTTGFRTAMGSASPVSMPTLTSVASASAGIGSYGYGTASARTG